MRFMLMLYLNLVAVVLGQLVVGLQLVGELRRRDAPVARGPLVPIQLRKAAVGVASGV